VILIVTHEDDPHVPLVTRHLDARRRPWAQLTTSRVGEGVDLRFSGDDRGACSVITTDDGQRIDPASVTAVWNRRRLVRPVRDPEAGPDDGLRHQYVREQRLALLDGVVAQAAGRWINPEAPMGRARLKLPQLARARTLGLSIPATLASDDPAAIREFAAAHAASGTVTKVLSASTPIVEDGSRQYMVFTHRFDPDGVSDEALAAAPAIYQAEIAKQFEARAIVIGDRVLTCRIDSQASVATNLDWRHYDFDHVAHEPIALPEAVDAALLRLCRAYGLTYAAIDLAYAADGRWVFFELNPNGQWGWLEELGGLPIGEQLARELSR
jgi:hypothetical protein